MYRITLGAGVVALALALAAADNSAEESTLATEILKKTDIERGGGLPGIAWNIHAQVKSRDSELVRDLKVKACKQDSVAEFTGPASVKGQKLLLVGRNMWFVQPGLQRPVPISQRQRLTGLASNGDIAATDYAGDYTAKVAREESINGESCYVLDLHANNKSVAYDRVLYWVSKSRLVALRADFYTVSGKALKSASFEYGNRISYQGRDWPFISRMTITDPLDPDSVTVMEYSRVQAARIPPSDFNVNLLVN
jgi:hypothetical protein